MDAQALGTEAKKQVPVMARFGLVSKGMVYILLGTILLLNSLHIQEQNAEPDKIGLLQWMQDSFAGKWMLPILALGLFCYAIWRLIGSYGMAKPPSSNWKKAARYFFSGVIYLLVGYTAMEIFINGTGGNSDNEQKLAAQLLLQPFGQWLLGIAALVLAAVGVYQIIYGLSGKYNKHVQKMNLHSTGSKILLSSGMIGYPARGIVWLIMAYLMFRAAVSNSSSKAGDTGKAFHFIRDVWGEPVLAIMAVGLIAYGLFNFIRARYEQFDR